MTISCSLASIDDDFGSVESHEEGLSCYHYLLEGVIGSLTRQEVFDSRLNLVMKDIQKVQPSF